MTTPTELHFTFDGKPIDANVDQLVIAGWTGRDTAAVEEHIAELEAIGVARPPATPCFYRASASLLTQAPSIQALGANSSGEAECFMLASQGDLWVGVGSDHTDRKVEAFDVTVSKQMCAKPVGPNLWRHADVADHWDDLVLRSYATNDGIRRLYQEGSIAALKPPTELIASYRDGGALEPGTLMFGGTLAVIGKVGGADRFEVEIYDPARDTSLLHAYDIQALPGAI
ncbi:MAG: DUF2848 domain-containing protein [Rhodospirillaceae bacterium]|jgi:hypothetical protein|nr:DUF2848 domain-containing protein [Rhodospirillaceae bacterium]MBT3884366.1 DUF2848 domain-containing protein [Rhodospirillaceae bacterium]MBT4117104.1 DUF2848 domain-containing protein [Rhodospirillaceae bacterium]MBT4672867.1 DUF2848 domain-containing protein [Rhodospirillaceae bacterium]MBT4721024.1 DUF2848 domain-containing protein [Rhodospirillaceae bacterium]